MHYHPSPPQQGEAALGVWPFDHFQGVDQRRTMTLVIDHRKSVVAQAEMLKEVGSRFEPIVTPIGINTFLFSQMLNSNRDKVIVRHRSILVP